MTSLTLSVLLQASILTAAPQAKTDEYAKAYAQSSANGQPLIVLVGADWCPACVTMKGSIMPEVRRRGGLGNVAFAQVNTDRQRALANQLMSGDGIPQLIMYYKAEGGWKRMQINGSTSAESVTSFINRGIAKNVAQKEKETPATATALSGDSTANASNANASNAAATSGSN